MLGDELGSHLELVHTPPLPPTRQLVLVEREVYGLEVQAPVAVLRFRSAESGWLRNGLPRFEAGDLLGIVSPADRAPRYYSLATGSREGFVEICVRKLAGGLCSEHLHALVPGATIEAFVRPNPDFRPNHNRRPLILIGAGAGIAPLAGLVRHNRRRPVHVFFGARHPHSDFLYEREFKAALADGRLASLTTAFSRVLGGGYVQDRLLEQAPRISELVERGAQIMVCGGREMAGGVREAFGIFLEPLGLSVVGLKRQRLYLEDAY
jgi:sulfite reductase (NADPH) flavoprotein alpha-component